MSGYNWTQGKSNNAVYAESNGLMNATNFAKWVRKFGRSYKGCTARDIATVIPVAEWHHTSKFFNRTNYYDPMIMEDSDLRSKLKNYISNRKEIDKLVKEHIKLGVKWLYGKFDYGWDEWLPLNPKQLYVDPMTIQRLKNSISYLNQVKI